MKDPHQNIFFYYRGPSNKARDPAYDPQIEDNTTKSLINVLEFFHEVQFNLLLESLLKVLDVPRNSILSFALQKGGDSSRPDALIRLANYNIYIEVKVRSPLKLDQLRRHLRYLNSRDWLLVISNNKSDKDYLSQFSDNRLLFLTWAEIHKLCLVALNQIKGDKRLVTIYQFLKYFVKYLEVVVMTEFNGFRSEDFDFWLDKNPHYVPILKKKLEAFTQIIKSKLPEGLRKIYSEIKIGNVSTKIADQRFAWVAIKKPENRGDKFNQCNFTIEVSKSSLDINTVIRNGHVTDRAKPIGIFYNKLLTQFEAFLKIINKIKRDAHIIVFKRLPKTGKRIMPGNEYWDAFFDMRLREITGKEDVSYLRDILKKADVSPAMPGVHIGYSIDRGEKILAEPEVLEKIIIETIVNFEPILSYLET